MLVVGVVGVVVLMALPEITLLLELVVIWTALLPAPPPVRSEGNPPLPAAGMDMTGAVAKIGPALKAAANDLS